MRVTSGMDAVPGMEDATLALSEAAIRAGSAFYETAAAAGEASARAGDLAASAAAAAGAATAPLKSLQALRDAVAGAGEDAGAPSPGVAGGSAATPAAPAVPAAPVAPAAGSAAWPMRSTPRSRRRAAPRTRSAAVDDRTAELAATLQSNVAQGLGQLFAGLITGATKLKDALGSVIARLGEMALTRGFETLLAGVGFGSGPIGQIASLILPARAAGGPVAAGLPYLVGERGPELIVPRGAGHGDPEPRGSAAAGSGCAVGDPRHRDRRPRQRRDPPDGRGRRRAGAARLRRPARRPGDPDRRRSPVPRLDPWRSPSRWRGRPSPTG